MRKRAAKRESARGRVKPLPDSRAGRASERGEVGNGGGEDREMSIFSNFYRPPSATIASSKQNAVILPRVSDPYIGQIVADEFRILARVGAGGMGSVYKAEQALMGRFVAVKILHSHYAKRSDLVSRFHREARAMSQLSHPNTVKVFTSGQLDDGSFYFVMEFLEGRNLAETVRDHGPLAPARAIPIMSAICGALEEAHRAGIIHRDLKPENILLTNPGGLEDFPKLFDFGLAKVSSRQMRPGSQILTQRGMVFGTPEFMSPEQARGDLLDGRSDVYSLGIVLYEALTGRLPFDAHSSMDYLPMQIKAEPIPLSQRVEGLRFPPLIELVVMRALAKRPEARFPSAAIFGEALRFALENPDLTELPEIWSENAGSPVPIPTLSSKPTPLPTAPEVAPALAARPPAAVSQGSWWVLGAGIVLALGGVMALAWTLLNG